MSEANQETAHALHSPLDSWHRSHGARMSEFGGWEMPLSYEDSGVVAEHQAVRSTVGLFDVSHLGKVSVKGAGARDFLNARLANDLNRIKVGSAQYTLALNDEGGVIDDLIAYLKNDDDVFLVPNAANSAAVAAKLQADNESANAGLSVSNEHRDYAIFAVQGPLSVQVLEHLGIPTPEKYMSFISINWHDKPLTVCRTGYTGEHGYELVPTWDGAVELWEALVGALEEYEGRVAGLGARDTLRTEMGYALHGHELTEEISPLEAGVQWAVGMTKNHFWGRDALLKQKAEGPARKSIGLVATERGVPRAGQNVVGEDGTPVGVTTSGTFSPTLETGIALALVESSADLSKPLYLDVRGRRLPVKVQKPPFVDVNTKA